MKIIGKKLSLKEFEDYLNDKNFGGIPPDRLVIHHTWKPTKKTWDGNNTIRSLKAYYESKGWSAGPHLFIAEDGIWLFTDMYDVGIHAGKGNAEWQKRTTGATYQGWGDDFKNYALLWYSIGIEVVGNYDNKVWSGETYKNAIGAIKVLMNELDIKEDKIFFHRDYSNKSCPGWAITKNWLFNELNKKEMSDDILTETAKALKNLFGLGDRINKNEDKRAADRIKKLMEVEEKSKKLIQRNARLRSDIATKDKEINALKETIEELEKDQRLEVVFKIGSYIICKRKK